MLQTRQIDQLLCLVAGLDRQSLIQQFTSYQSDFPVDFSQDFLENQPMDRLRHIFVALCLQHQRLPDSVAA